MRDFRPLAEQRWTCPAVLREGAEGILDLPSVTRRRDGPIPYGGLFLDSLSRTDADSEALPFNVAYPNAYLVAESGVCILLTHGHYFDPFWSYLGTVAPRIAGKDLRFQTLAGMNMDEYVSVNFPFHDLARSGLGQAGPLAHVVRLVQKEFKGSGKEPVHTVAYADRLREYLMRSRSRAGSVSSRSS